MKTLVTIILAASIVSGCQTFPEPTAKIEMWQTGEKTARVKVTTQKNVEHVDFKIYEME